MNERTKHELDKAAGPVDQFVHSKIQASDRKFLQPKVAPSYADPLGDRGKARSKIRNARAKERWTLALVLVITCVPVLATLFAIIYERPPYIPWSSGPTEYTDAVVQALGYMTEGDGPTLTGELIRDFVLLPEVGDALHPAHRFGDQRWPSTFEKEIKSGTRPRLL